MDEIKMPPEPTTPPIISDNGNLGFNVNIEDPEKTLYEMKKDGSLDRGPVGSNGKPIILPDSLGKMKYILQDALAGDPKALNSPELASLELDKIKKALEYLAKSNNLTDRDKALLATEGWRMTFRAKPPTPEEFLTPKYIGDMANSLHPWIRNTFLKFFNPIAPYRNLVLSSCIGTGKSTLTVLCNLYIATQFAYMKFPYKYYGGAPSTMYSLVFGGFSQKKCFDLLIGPLTNVLRQSDFFKQCIRYDEMIQANKEFSAANGISNIYWTTAAPTSSLSMSNGLNFNIASQEGDFLGQNVIMGSCTELGFWREQGGWNDDQIYSFFTKLRDRIDSRMRHNRISGFILDSSPNTLESVIDDWIWRVAPEDSSCLCFTGARWDFYKSDFPGCLDENGLVKHDWTKCFPMFVGGNGLPPRPIESEADLSQFNATSDVIWCPRMGGGANMYEKAKLTPIEFLKDWCGKPAGAADHIFGDKGLVENVFDNNLKNIFGQITAPAEEEPEHLIWNQVKDQFFNKVMDKYYFYYEPGVPRTLSVDQSYAGDVTGISMTHIERDPERRDNITGEPLSVYVTDFTIVIIPKGGIINLDAIKCFIYDLISIGNIKLKHVSYDGFQSESARQFLKRKGVMVEYVSVDKTPDAYLDLIDLVSHGRYFCGKNIYMKNNMFAIQKTIRKGDGKMKIDHTSGKIVTNGDGNWNSDQRGINAKDALDSATASVALIKKYSNEFIPFVVWNPDSSKDRDYETMKTKVTNFLTNAGFAI